MLSRPMFWQLGAAIFCVGLFRHPPPRTPAAPLQHSHKEADCQMALQFLEHCGVAVNELTPEAGPVSDWPRLLGA